MEWSDLWEKVTDNLVLAGASIPGLAALFMSTRREKEKTANAFEIAQNDADLKTRQMLTAEQTAWFDRMRTENADLRAQVVKAEAEADDAWRHVRRMQAEGFASPPRKPPIQHIEPE